MQNIFTNDKNSMPKRTKVNLIKNPGAKNTIHELVGNIFLLKDIQIKDKLINCCQGPVTVLKIGLQFWC